MQKEKEKSQQWNEVDTVKKKAGSKTRDMVKHIKKSDQRREYDVGGRVIITSDEE